MKMYTKVHFFSDTVYVTDSAPSLLDVIHCKLKLL